MPLITLRQIGHSCCNFVRKACRVTNWNRSPCSNRSRGSHVTGSTHRRRCRLPLRRKYRSAQVHDRPAGPSATSTFISAHDDAFLDFDGTQAAAERELSLGQLSHTQSPDPAKVASVQVSLELPSSIQPMPDRLPKSYELVRTLNGELGHFKNPIHLVRRRSSGKQFIVKQLPVADKRDSPLEDPLDDLPEVSLLQNLDHSNIIAIESVHLDYNGPCCIANIVLPYCDAGDVADFVASLAASQQRVPVQFVQHLVSSMLDAILYMHHGETYNAADDTIHHQRHSPVFHRDIKERNIFITKSKLASNGLPTVVVGDFGLASSNPVNTGVSGTTGYIAPEILCGSFDDADSDDGQVLQGTAGDWYAFGVTLYQIITGKGYIFQASDVSRVALAPLCEEQEIVQLILDCLRGVPAYRPQASDSLRLHRLSARLKADLQAWYDEGGRLSEDIWPEAFRFERVGPVSEVRSADDWANFEPPLQEAPVIAVPYTGAMQFHGSSSHAWLRPKVGLRRRIVPPRLMQ